MTEKMFQEKEKPWHMDVEQDAERMSEKDPDFQIKKYEDGWVWRCWECGALGTGLYSKEAAYGEYTRHKCDPEA